VNEKYAVTYMRKQKHFQAINFIGDFIFMKKAAE